MEMHRPEQSSIQHAPMTQDNSLRIVLSRANDPQTCPFWVGVYKSAGTGTTKEFLQIEKIDEAFKYLSETGLSEDQPLMLSDNTGATHRQFFLLPQKAFAYDPQAGKTLVLKTLEALVQTKAGLYLAPSLLHMPETRQLLSELIVGLARLKTEEVYLLTTDIGVNQLLNISLAVKESLKNKRDVWIFH
ncbi:MAG: hypothetical protein EOP04_08310 [Proteobacteria bacterium]|nr:MAG: hypothetical protein EOP04_08310 [Pseudomonadota bacterium]